MAYSRGSKGIQLSVDNDEFYCPHCCEVFTEPKLLSNCAHSFCKECLRELTLRSFNSSQVSCPVCRNISNLPRNGVDGLATNTLLVRLIANIPGRKEKDAIVKALKRCKQEIEKQKSVQDQLVMKLSELQEYQEQGLKLKMDISEHAQKAIDSARKWELRCHKVVDSHLSQNCGMDVYEQLNEQRNKRKRHFKEAESCIQNAEELLKRDRMKEILEMKSVVEARLNEYSNIPQCPLLQEAKNVQGFSMEFEKNEVEFNLGKMFDKKDDILVAESCDSVSYCSPAKKSKKKAEWQI